mgnify:CR=1 FL=1
MTHPLVDQLRFTRSEFLRGIRGVTEADAQRRIEPMNAIGWNVGHLAWQEQQYFVTWPTGRRPFPDIDREFASGGPASTPALERVLAAWTAITAEADGVIYHYWFHIGENAAIRQQLGHERLPQFVGSIDSKAPYRPDRA